LLYPKTHSAANASGKLSSAEGHALARIVGLEALHEHAALGIARNHRGSIASTPEQIVISRVSVIQPEAAL